MLVIKDHFLIDFSKKSGNKNAYYLWYSIKSKPCKVIHTLGDVFLSGRVLNNGKRFSCFDLALLKLNHLFS